jgi:hypothetical protein
MILHKRERPLGYHGFKIMQNGHADNAFTKWIDLVRGYFQIILKEIDLFYNGFSKEFFILAWF